MKRAVPILCLVALVAVLLGGDHTWAQAPGQVVTFQSVQKLFNNLQQQINAIRAGGGGGGVTGVINQQSGNPFFTQVASQNTNYTAFTYSLPANILALTQVDLAAHFTYRNTLSADTPNFTVNYGATTVASGPVPTAIGAISGATEILLYCHIAATLGAGAESGACWAIIGGQAVIIGANDAMAENSANALPLTISYSDPNSNNSTINLYWTVVSTPQAATGATITGGPGFTGAFTGPLSLLGNGSGTGIDNVPIGQHTAQAGSFSLLSAPTYQSSGANPAASGLLRGINNSTIAASRNAANTADLSLLSTDPSNLIHIGGMGAAGVSLDSTTAVSQGSFSSAAYFDYPNNNSNWTGSSESCGNKWHNYTQTSTTATLTLACPAVGTANETLEFNIFQGATPGTFSFAAANGAQIYAVGGTLPTACSTAGCLDQIEVTWSPTANIYSIKTIGANLESVAGGGGGPVCPTGQTCYYVSAAGSDSNAGTSTSTTWLTVAKAASVLSTLNPGDEILFHGGDTWTGQMMTFGDTAAHSVSGTAAKPIIIGTYGTSKAIFDAGGTQPECFVTNNPPNPVKYLTLNNFECKHASVKAVSFTAGATTSTTPQLPGITVEAFYIHNTGNGCSSSSVACVGTDEGAYSNQLAFQEFTAACEDPASSVGGCAPEGVKFLNNVVRWTGGHNCIEVHSDYGPFQIVGNTVGPGCVHANIDFKNGGTAAFPFASHAGLVANNLVDQGASLSLQGGPTAPGIFTENDWNPNSGFIIRGNTIYDSEMGIQICNDDSTGNGGSVACNNSGGCSLSGAIYNNTIYSFFNSTGQYGLYAPYCNATGLGTATIDVRNNIWDGSGFAYLNHLGGNPVLTNEDFNDCGASQGSPTLFTPTCGGANDKHNVDPLFISPSQNAITSATPPNFGLQAASTLHNAGQVGLTPGNNSIGASP